MENVKYRWIPYNIYFILQYIILFFLDKRRKYIYTKRKVKIRVDFLKDYVIYKIFLKIF